MVQIGKRLTPLLALAVLAAVAPAPAPAADDLARGEQLFDLCKQCHAPDGGGDPLALAPSIAGLDRWYLESQLQMFRLGARGKHPDDVGGMRMYPMALWLRSDADVEAVSAYVASLPRVFSEPTLNGADLEKGKTFFTTICVTCHGEQGKGDQTKFAPPIGGQNDWYVFSTLKKFKAGIRGDDPRNTNAVMMRGMSNTLPDDQAMRDVAGYVTSLGR